MLEEAEYFVNITGGAGGTDSNFTMARKSAHTNVSHLFHEDERRVPTEDGLSVVPGFMGAYPNALFEVPRESIEAFVDAIVALDGPKAYQALRARFGVLRSSDRFWAFSDRIHTDHQRESPSSGGLFDFNRLEAY